ncbi:P-loop containing nucleoside triphosphate hydrolase protein [Lepidopterella palustris CBS 459.81]|uniref:P-loop containing nucleoside triphosphate hydrolase protein n=1 Tax=Lepidopterella palustris CBS 459.81 TaxID=1314670 RepID=A0A8E2JFM3_9PEZI|nr:P-loop containing nucleoside triphosphate hydrolase protein [Lepidopterella palustris CBS 459.81]
MTVDLLQVLPDFDTKPYSHLLPSLDKALITTNDLITLDAVDIARRAQVPVVDLRKLAEAVLATLHQQLGFGDERARSNGLFTGIATGGVVTGEWKTISTLDEGLDAALGGGFPTGHLVEVTGESGAGKTQLLLTLLLSSQLAPPRGLSRSALYISTEAPLATTRLTQLLSTHPHLCSLPLDKKPSLAKILSIQTPDLESQDHIIRYQLPVAIQRHGIGLVVVDSIAANYRAEFERGGARAGAAAMAKRGTQLVQLGALLRDLARTKDIAIVMANQVGDRFMLLPNQATNAVSRTVSFNSQNGDADTGEINLGNRLKQESQTAVISPVPLALDHQQRWFTGWGDRQSISYSRSQGLKTPSLGLVWTNQISCRIALIKEPVYVTRPTVTSINGNDTWNESETDIARWRRWFKVVFAPWVEPSDVMGIEFEILRNGLKHVANDKAAEE